VTPEVESARREWDDAYRRFEDEIREPRRSESLRLELAIVTDELRKRLGSTFTLRELAAEYVRADDWARAAVSERAAAPGWPRTLSFVEGAAFHLYARAALDYAP
jgi:hypothetical protein